MKYKEFELIMSSFKCDKNCPYCTAKITKWPAAKDQVNLLEQHFKKLRDIGINFRYFILSGNGEPSLYDIGTLKTICNATRAVNIFDEKRIQSSGNIFFEPKKLDLFKHDFMIEITRTHFDSKQDMQTLGYKRDYIATEAFRNTPNIRLNYVMLKTKSFDEYMTELRRYIDTYPNIKTISLKTLNLNTMDSGTNNPYSSWILQNGMTKSDTDTIIKNMSKYAEFVVADEKFFDRYEWIYNGVPITFYAKKLDYGYSNVVCYGGKLVDYHLRPIKLFTEKQR